MSAPTAARSDEITDLPPPPTDGLTTAEAAQLFERHGANELTPERRRGGPWVVLWRSVSEPMSLLLIVAATTYLVLGDIVDGIAALAALIPIAAVSVVLERRAERALEELAALTAPTAAVWRDGRWMEITARQVVPSDVIGLREGDVVPADATLLVGGHLIIDESTLTGESLPVDKDVGAELWAGTTVRAGRAAAEVTVTGSNTRFGTIGGLVAASTSTRTPLERTVRKLVLRLGVVAAVFSLLVSGTELVRGAGWGAAIIAGVSLGIAAIPEEFPLVFTIYLALGARRLSRRNALVRKLTGVETLGSTTVICTDKTGTLTMGDLDVARLEAFGARDGLPSLLEAAILASEPKPFDPLDQALVRHAEAAGVDVERLHAGDLVRDYEFDPVHKYVTHVWSLAEGSVATAKGAVEGIPTATAASPEVRHKTEAVMGELGDAGMRVIAVAAGAVDHISGERQTDEASLRLLGVIGFADPTRPEVPTAVADCRTAGIRIIMITGDHPVTARAVADGLGIDGGEVVTGDDLDGTDEDDVERLALSSSVFARIRPEQKHRLVQALRRRGEVVAMTGDGINDAPALREADIGVAMGRRGTAVAREAATLVLLDDDFATIVGAVREGRRIFRNLRHAFGYLIAFHVPLLLLALVVPLIGRPLLLLPLHLIVLEFLLHPIVALVFENDPGPGTLMTQSPRKPGAGLIDRGMTWPFLRGVVLALVVGTLYVSSVEGGIEQARGIALASLFIGELLLVTVERAGPYAVWRRSGVPNRVLIPLLAAGAALVAVLFLLPWGREIMSVGALTPGEWLIAGGAAMAATLWSEPFKHLSTRRE